MCNRFVKTKENVWTHLTMCNISNPHFDSKRVLSKEKCNVFVLDDFFINKYLF